MTLSELRRATLPWVAAVIGIAVSLGAWHAVLTAEHRAARAHFERRAVERALHIQHQLEHDLSAVESVAALFAASLLVTRDQFRTVTAHLLARHPSLRGLSWNPRISDAERSAYEDAVRREGPADFRITERSPDGEMVAAARRPDYTVVRYIEPYPDNEEALGYDVGSEPLRRAALERAAATAELTLTAAITLVQDEEREPGFLAFHPVYRPVANAHNDRRAHLAGFAVGVFQVADVVETAGRRSSELLRVRIEDVTDPGAIALLYPQPGAEQALDAGEAEIAHLATLQQGGRTWQLRLQPEAPELAEHRTWLAPASLGVGLLVTGLVVAYLSVLLSRAQRMEQLAQEREERRRLEARLQQAQKLESLGVLAGGIAHDFNNLLTGVLGNADLALAELSPESPGREELEQVRLAATRAADLTRQMLAYSGRSHFTSELLDLSRLVAEMVHLLESSISKKAKLRCEFASELPPIEGDPTQIRQVVMNLITNASDALGGEEGVLSLRTGVREFGRDFLTEVISNQPLPPARYVFLEVSDSGCGMDAAIRQRIFDPFFTTKFQGRGLGLAAALGILRSHGGGVRVDSEPERGATFTLLFPCAERAIVSATADRSERERDWRGSGTVLVVDDEEPVRRLANRMLSRLGFHVRTASDGDEALEVFRRHADEIVAVLLDVTMPRLGGVEVLRALRAVRRDVPIVLSSGYAEEDSLVALGDERPDAFLAKPYTSRALAESLRGALGV